MDAKDIRKLNWVHVEDWSELTSIYSSSRCKIRYVGEEDVENFIENIFKNISRKLNISYDELFQIQEKENSAFYKTKVNLFLGNEHFTKSDPALLELQKMLRVPDINSLKDNNAEKILHDFSMLSDTEKIEVLKRLELISVKVESNKY